MTVIKNENKWCAIPGKKFYSVLDSTQIGGKTVVIAGNLDEAITKFMDLGYKF